VPRLDGTVPFHDADYLPLLEMSKANFLIRRIMDMAIFMVFLNFWIESTFTRFIYIHSVVITVAPKAIKLDFFDFSSGLGGCFVRSSHNSRNSFHRRKHSWMHFAAAQF
jgi:hypothetical protein